MRIRCEEPVVAGRGGEIPQRLGPGLRRAHKRAAEARGEECVPAGLPVEVPHQLGGVLRACHEHGPGEAPAAAAHGGVQRRGLWALRALWGLPQPQPQPQPQLEPAHGTRGSEASRWPRAAGSAQSNMAV